MAAPGPSVRAGRLVILGASGDLTERYLLAALAEMACFGFLPADSTITGVARDEWDTAQVRRHAADRLERRAAHLSRSGREELVARLTYVAVTSPTRTF